MFKEFYEIASQEAYLIDEKYQALENEENRIRERLDEIANERARMVKGKERLAAYVAACTTNAYTCPYCFMRDSATVEMKPIPSTNDRRDVLECSHCYNDIETEW
ncbi:MAG: hypothetical protein M5U09_23745 [Gammaproteobacteria bacterium]|nr:hypothetical protein [Gammaproteobacteria bacterium]